MVHHLMIEQYKVNLSEKYNKVIVNSKVIIMQIDNVNCDKENWKILLIEISATQNINFRMKEIFFKIITNSSSKN